MDRLTTYRRIVQEALTEQTVVPVAFGSITLETIFDTDKDRYMVAFVGWQGKDRVYGPLVHVDIIDGKLWIQRDGTAEGLPNVLLQKGIRKEEIVLAYRTSFEQKLMGFALAE